MSAFTEVRRAQLEAQSATMPSFVELAAQLERVEAQLEEQSATSASCAIVEVALHFHTFFRSVAHFALRSK